MIALAVLAGLMGCDKAPSPVEPVEDTGKFTTTAGTYSGPVPHHVTGWKDPSPPVKPFVARPLPLAHEVVQMPEFCDNAALRQTLLTLRRLATVGHRTITQVNAAQCRVRGSRSWGGHLTFETRDENGRWDTSTRVYAQPLRYPGGLTGDYVIALGNGHFRVLSIDDFHAQYSVDGVTYP